MFFHQLMTKYKLYAAAVSSYLRVTAAGDTRTTGAGDNRTYA